MHFEILVEDRSGKIALDILIPKIIGDTHTFRVTSFKGIGHIPRSMASAKNISNRMLLNNLPKLLKAYGKSLQDYGVVFVVCDLDDKCLKNFRVELLSILDNCNPRPETRFCIAVEEAEAWFLGDITAIKQAYPKARDTVLNAYVNDSICGAWEQLADAVYRGGAQALTKLGGRAEGAEKSVWAENITPYMDVDNNLSLSFNYFLRKLREFV
ncbi:MULTISPECIES: hypothetical protein [Methylomicrobium]|uniref:DUF4276 domain-containing protein n=1 Tax=Methylomicrobium album BG8 TaxID=686340 RepID=H8GHC4_METAL|nr:MULTISPECIES: hypothetical protein [Methylomicrobium]EIC28915.1 hypothetical protein Metal_1097 [Methylomicrobium album BG8]